ncbi:MAG: 4'-phosphopantetheinyl transferase superfamily protein [Saprospiraceae bacterium]
MIKVFYADSRACQEQYSLLDLLAKLPASMKERAFRYRFPKDAFNFVLGRLMLQRGIRDFGLSPTSLETLQYNEQDKPLLPELFFNISHSEHLIVCAMTQLGDLGIDIEVIRPMELEHFKSCFTPSEWQTILQAENSLNQFLTYWTQKESVIKATGMGLSQLNQVVLDISDEIQLDGETWYLQPLSLREDCLVHLCSQHAGVTVELIDFVAD